MTIIQFMSVLSFFSSSWRLKQGFQSCFSSNEVCISNMKCYPSSIFPMYVPIGCGEQTSCGWQVTMLIWANAASCLSNDFCICSDLPGTKHASILRWGWYSSALMVFNKHEEIRTKRVRNILVAITGSNDTLIYYNINHTYYKLVPLEKGGRVSGWLNLYLF